MSASEIERTLVRLAYEIVEKNSGVDAWDWLVFAAAEFRLQNGWAKSSLELKMPKCPWERWISHSTGMICPRSARSQSCSEKEIGFDIEDKNIVLVDDVLFTGRTTRAALDALFSHGRPRSVQFCVLIDRGHREIPVEATFVGRHVQTTDNEVIEVKLTEVDDAEKVLMMER